MSFAPLEHQLFVFPTSFPLYSHQLFGLSAHSPYFLFWKPLCGRAQCWALWYWKGKCIRAADCYLMFSRTCTTFSPDRGSVYLHLSPWRCRVVVRWACMHVKETLLLATGSIECAFHCCLATRRAGLSAQPERYYPIKHIHTLGLCFARSRAVNSSHARGGRRWYL